MAGSQSGQMPNPVGLTHLQDVTQRYARYSHSAAGLSNVIGGGLFLVVYLAGGLFDLAGWARIVIGSGPIVYIVAKEVVQRRYYQRHGRVTELIAGGERRLHVRLTVFTVLVSAGILTLALVRAVQGSLDNLSLGDAGYLAYVAALPILVWFFLRTSGEFIIGVGLIAQAAVILAGGHYPLLSVATLIAIAAALLIALGIRQHREYLRLEGELRALRGGA